MDDTIIVITTLSNEKDAKNVAKKLLEKRIIACAQITAGVTSLYWWEKRIVEDAEWVVSMKTLKRKYDALVALN